MLRPILLLFLCFVVQSCGRPVASDPATLLHPLIDPAKLANLGDRAANPRVQKITAILWRAKQDGHDPAVVAGKAVALIGWGGTEKGRLTAAAMVRNVTILERLGGTTPEDLANMRRGRTATVRQGPYAGERCPRNLPSEAALFSTTHEIACPCSEFPSLIGRQTPLKLQQYTRRFRGVSSIADKQRIST